MPNKVHKPRLGAKRGGLAKIGSMKELQVALWEIIIKLKGEIVTKGELIESFAIEGRPPTSHAGRGVCPAA